MFLLLLSFLGLALPQLPESGDPIVVLQQKLDAGEVTLDFDPEHGYLSSVLEKLKIPVSSQGLVFSKTSLQVDFIAPWSPRAVYFNDDVYVGWTTGGPFIEIASIDPSQGTVFYTLDQTPSDRPSFKRETTTCHLCHKSQGATAGIPGLIVRSVYPDRYGYMVPTSDKGVTTDRTPLEDRWGGWYVTGTSGDQLHMGNMSAAVPAQEIGNYKNFLAKMDLRPNVNITDLSQRFNTKPYLSPHSDIVALLVIAHQAFVHNLIAKTNVEARKATPETIANAGEPLVRGLLFSREAPLTSTVRGTTDFAEKFADQGPHDSRGRSLREFDLEKRLFRYPLSYMIYSDAFNALPPLAKDYVYRRLREVLTGADQSTPYAHLSPADRTAILQILEETNPAF